MKDCLALENKETQYQKFLMDSGEKRKQQQSSLISRKCITKSTEKAIEQLENMGIQGQTE